MAKLFPTLKSDRLNTINLVYTENVANVINNGFFQQPVLGSLNSNSLYNGLVLKDITSNTLILGTPFGQILSNT